MDFDHSVDAPVTRPHVGSVLSIYVATVQFLVFPAASDIVIVPEVCVPELNVLENESCEHPLPPLSEHATVIVRLCFHVDDVPAPVTVPHVGAV